VATDLEIENIVARAARTPLALSHLQELGAALAGADLTELVRAALDANEIDAATALGLVAAMRKVVLASSILERLLPEVDSIMYLAALLQTCSDEELTDLVCRLCQHEALTSEREALSLFVACARSPNRRPPPSLVARVRRGLRRQGTPEVGVFVRAAAAQLDDPHVNTLLGGLDLANPAIVSARAHLVATFVDDPLSLLPEQPLPKVIQGYTYVRLDREQARNDLCACGSGKKYKRCCALRRDRPELRVSETGFHLGLLQPGMAKRVPRDQFEQFRASELARFSPAELDSMQLATALRSLLSFGRFEAAESIVTELATRDDRFGKHADDYREELFERAVKMGRMDVAERQFACLAAADAVDARIRLRLDLSKKAPDALQSLEVRARAALAGDAEAWYDIAFGLLDHSPALGVLVSRGSFLRDRMFDNETLYESILDARDELGVEPDEDYADVLDTLTARSARLVSAQAKPGALAEPNHDVLARAQSDIQDAQVEGLALEQQLHEREQAFHELEARYEALQQAAPHELLNTVTKLKAEIDEVQSERRAQRARIEELKNTIREGAEQRRLLRKQVAEAMSSNKAGATASPTTMLADFAQDEPEARFLEDVAEQPRQPLRRLVISQRAHDQLVALPRDVATRALTLCATLAAGRAHAFIGVKKLKRVQDIYSARVDRAHRLLFVFSPVELHVTEVIERRDLELAIEHLRSQQKLG
jgi:hypothetical protein